MVKYTLPEVQVCSIRAPVVKLLHILDHHLVGSTTHGALELRKPSPS